MSVKKQMMRARQLIQEKKYDEARDILEQVNHPAAEEWLAKLDSRATKSSRKQPTNKEKPIKSAEGKAAKSSSRPNFLLPLILIVVLLVIVGGAAAVILPSLSNNNDTENTTEAIADAQTADENEDSNTDDTNTEGSNDSSENDEQPADTSDTETALSGIRIPILFSTDFLFEAELPAGYSCNCDGAINSISHDDSRESFRLDYGQRAFDPDYYLDKSIDEMLAENLRDDENISHQETVQADGRDVVIAHITDEDGETDITYNVKDSDGHIIRMIISDSVDEPELLHDGILSIAATIEGNSGNAPDEFSAQLNETSIWFDEDSNRWYFVDPARLSRRTNVELPDGWVIDTSMIFRMAVKDGDPDTSATSISYMQRIFDDDITLEEWINDHFESRTGEAESQEVLSMNEREIVIRVEYDASADQRTTTYFVKDSEDNLISIITQPSVADQAALRDDILFMASNVESEDDPWEDKLRRIGVLEG